MLNGAIFDVRKRIDRRLKNSGVRKLIIRDQKIIYLMWNAITGGGLTKGLKKDKNFYLVI